MFILLNLWIIGKRNAVSPEKEEFYSNWNKGNNAGSDHNHAKRICKDFEIKNLCKYHDFLKVPHY